VKFSASVALKKLNLALKLNKIGNFVKSMKNTLNFDNLQKSASIFIQLNMDQTGLIFAEPTIGIQSITINAASIQAALLYDGNFNTTIEQFIKIASVLGVDSISRIGLRTNFTHYFDNEEDFRNYFEERIKFKEFINASIVLKTKISDKYLAKIRIVPIENNKDNKKGVLFDIDIYFEKEESMSETQDNFKAMYGSLEETVKKYV
jgi:hypothetical protein